MHHAATALYSAGWGVGWVASTGADRPRPGTRSANEHGDVWPMGRPERRARSDREPRRRMPGRASRSAANARRGGPGQRGDGLRHLRRDPRRHHHPALGLLGRITADARCRRAKGSPLDHLWLGPLLGWPRTRGRRTIASRSQHQRGLRYVPSNQRVRSRRSTRRPAPMGQSMLVAIRVTPERLQLDPAHRGTRIRDKPRRRSGARQQGGGRRRDHVAAESTRPPTRRRCPRCCMLAAFGTLPCRHPASSLNRPAASGAT